MSYTIDCINVKNGLKVNSYLSQLFKFLYKLFQMSYYGSMFYIFGSAHWKQY